MKTVFRYWLGALIGVAAIGCEGTVSLLPATDSSLRKTPAAFAADAAKRQYESDAKKVPDTEFRADYALILRQIDLANISAQDWDNVEIWINGTYVVYVPHFEKKTDKTLYFTMFYDRNGRHFDTNFGQNPIKSLEVFRSGAMFSVVDHVAD
jgi:hypothetical protein